MSDRTIQCATHGEAKETFVCSHLIGQSSGLGFNRDEPSPDNPFPNAWCDDCEIIRSQFGGWNRKSEKLVKISLLCSGCYERARIRNTHTDVTLDNLANLRWKCGSCDEWHFGPCLDFSVHSPIYWTDKRNRVSSPKRQSSNANKHNGTFLDDDFCAIDDRDFFVRGIIPLPIIGTAETLRWGVWGSLSRQNFETLWRLRDVADSAALPPMFSWLSTRIPEYPDTLNLKMYAHIQEPDMCPEFELEPSNHPLSQEFHHGIHPDRVRIIMLKRLRDAGY